MSFIRRSGVLAVLLSTIGLGSVAAQELSPEAQLQEQRPALESRAKHGDWEIVCGQAEGGGEECVMAQAVNNRETNRPVLAAMVMKPPAKDPILRLTVPLGVLLPRGLNFEIDGREVGGTGFLYCLVEGCVTQVTLEAELVSSLKAGQKAIATVYRPDDQPLNVPLSLAGFTAAFNDF